VALALISGERADDEIEICSIEGQLVVVGFSDVKITTDVFGHFGRGGGGEAEDAGDLEFFGEAGEFEVVGAEVVAPF